MPPHILVLLYVTCLFPYQMSYCNSHFISNLPFIYKRIDVSRYMSSRNPVFFSTLISSINLIIIEKLIAPLSKNSEINEEHTLILPLLSVLTFYNITMDNINYVLYIFLLTLCYISIIPFTSIFHSVTMFTSHIVYDINVLCYFFLIATRDYTLSFTPLI